MDSSSPHLDNSQAGQTSLRGDEEAQLGLLESPPHNNTSDGGQRVSYLQHPWILVDIVAFMFCMSFSVTCYVSIAIWTFQLFCFTVFRSTTEPDVFALLRMIKFFPVIFAIAATSELAGYIWWRLQSLFGRRHLEPWYSFPVYKVLRILFNACDVMMNYLFPIRRRWSARRRHAPI